MRIIVTISIISVVLLVAGFLVFRSIREEDTEDEGSSFKEFEGSVYRISSGTHAERAEVGVKTKKFDNLASRILDDLGTVDNTEETLRNLFHENIERELFDELARNIMIFWIENETKAIREGGEEISIDKVEIGDKVRGLWERPVMESFPAQVRLEKFILLENE